MGIINEITNLKNKIEEINKTSKELKSANNKILKAMRARLDEIKKIDDLNKDLNFAIVFGGAHDPKKMQKIEEAKTILKAKGQEQENQFDFLKMTIDKIRTQQQEQADKLRPLHREIIQIRERLNRFSDKAGKPETWTEEQRSKFKNLVDCVSNLVVAWFEAVSNVGDKKYAKKLKEIKSGHCSPVYALALL